MSIPFLPKSSERYKQDLPNSEDSDQIAPTGAV